jgi:Uri superfamily endonuclease
MLQNTGLDLDIKTLDNQSIKRGWYGYIGSAQTDSYSRVDRHKDVSQYNKSINHWNIDYLLGKETCEMYGYFKTSAEPSKIVESIDSTYIDKFGTSDCSCQSHLYMEDSASHFTQVTTRALDYCDCSWEYEDLT